jgi:hypothetical protein
LTRDGTGVLNWFVRLGGLHFSVCPTTNALPLPPCSADQLLISVWSFFLSGHFCSVISRQHPQLSRISADLTSSWEGIAHTALLPDFFSFFFVLFSAIVLPRLRSRSCLVFSSRSALHQARYFFTPLSPLCSPPPRPRPFAILVILNFFDLAFLASFFSLSLFRYFPTPPSSLPPSLIALYWSLPRCLLLLLFSVSRLSHPSNRGTLWNEFLMVYSPPVLHIGLPSLTLIFISSDSVNIVYRFLHSPQW